MHAPRVLGAVFSRSHVVAAVLLALAALLGACQKGDSEPPLPPLTPFDPALTERLHEIRDTASEVRGLPANMRIEEGWFDQEALRVYDQEFIGHFEEDILEQVEASNIAFRLLHLIEADDDLLDIYTSSGGNIAGLYYYVLDKLALVSSGGEIAPEDELTLAHEYVHSFQDGLWNIEELDKLIEKDADENSSSEFATTIRCLIEGDATFSEVAYAEEVYGSDWVAEVYGDVEEAPEPEPDEELPIALQRYFSFNYTACPVFVAAIYAWGGWEAVDDLYDDPPRSTEAILHPDRYLTDRDIGSIVPLAELHEELDGWERLSLLPFGEFDVLVYLATILEDEKVAMAASTGWDGGRSAVYTREDDEGDQQVLIHIGLAFDTEADRDEFLRAFEDVVAEIATSQKSGDASVRWTEEAGFGRAWWDVERFRRFDLLVANDKDALNAAAAAAGASDY
jgi:hypothetical protein